MAGIRADVSLNVNTTNVKRSLDKATNEINKTIGKINGKQVSFNVNGRSFTQPLGRITASANEFTKSLEASNARVIAFGASVGIINGVTAAFKNLVLETVRFEKTLQDINVVLGLSNQAVERFGQGLFDVARNTAQSFNIASEAALEFSRQGLATEEVLKRTNDALILTRLTGLDAAEAVAGLTAAVNAFGDAGLTTTDIIDKLAAVDVKFAVSSEDLVNGLERAGAVAIDAGVELDSLIGLIAALQQTTARGGAVIGNSLKTIFTRIQRPESIRQIEDLGVAVRNMQGEVLSADRILLNMAKSFNTLTQAQQSNVVQFSAGIFQANVFRAILRDLSKEQSLQAQATEVSANAAGDAAKKNELLNKTLAALASQAGTGIRELAGIVGELAVKPEIGAFLEFFVEKIEDIKNLLGAGEDEGSAFAKGLVRGIGNVLTGPAAIAFGAVFIKMFVNIAKFASTSLKDVLGIVSQKERIAQMEQSIVEALASNRNIQESLNNLEGDRLAQEKYILGIIEAQTSAMREQQMLASRLAKPLLRKGVSPDLTMQASSGLIPEPVKSKEKQGARKGGYAPGAVDSMNVPGLGQVVYNKAETVKQFPGMKQPAIMPPETSRAGSQYQNTFKQKHGFDPYASYGFVPNFAIQKGSKLVMDKAKLKLFGNDVSIGKALGKNYKEIQDHFEKNIPITVEAGLERIITSSDKSKKTATGKESLFNAFTALHAKGIKSIQRNFDIRSLGGLKAKGLKQGRLTKAEFTEKKVENLLKREGDYQRTESPEINRGLSNYPIDLIAYGQNYPSYEVKSGSFDAANLILKSLRMASDRELPNWMQQNKISGGKQLKERNLKRASSLARKLDLYDPKQKKSARQEGFQFGQDFADEWGLSQGLVPSFAVAKTEDIDKWKDIVDQLYELQIKGELPNSLSGAAKKVKGASDKSIAKQILGRQAAKGSKRATVDPNTISGVYTMLKQHAESDPTFKNKLETVQNHLSKGKGTAFVPSKDSKEKVDVDSLYFKPGATKNISGSWATVKSASPSLKTQKPGHAFSDTQITNQGANAAINSWRRGKNQGMKAVEDYLSVKPQYDFKVTPYYTYAPTGPVNKNDLFHAGIKTGDDFERLISKKATNAGELKAARAPLDFVNPDGEAKYTSGGWSGQKNFKIKDIIAKIVRSRVGNNKNAFRSVQSFSNALKSVPKSGTAIFMPHAAKGIVPKETSGGHDDSLAFSSQEKLKQFSQYAASEGYPQVYAAWKNSGSLEKFRTTRGRHYDRVVGRKELKYPNKISFSDLQKINISDLDIIDLQKLYGSKSFDNVGRLFGNEKYVKEPSSYKELSGALAGVKSAVYNKEDLIPDTGMGSIPRNVAKKLYDNFVSKYGASHGIVPNYAVTLSNDKYYSKKSVEQGISQLYKKSGGRKPLNPKELDFAAERYISAVADSGKTYPGGHFNVGGKKFQFNEVSMSLMKHGQFYQPKEGEAIDLSKDFSGGFIPNFALTGKEYAKFSVRLADFIRNNSITPPIKSLSSREIFKIPRRNATLAEKTIQNIRQFISSSEFEGLDEDIKKQVKKDYNKIAPRGLSNPFRPFAKYSEKEFSGDFEKGRPSLRRAVAQGLVPNFTNPLREAIKREKDAGVPESKIRIEKSPELKSRQNPMGLAVTNTRDEPHGVGQGIRRAKLMGIDPKRHGASKGFVPNFATAEDVDRSNDELAKSVKNVTKYNKESADSANEKADADKNAADKTNKFSDGGLMKLFVFQSLLSTANGFLQEFAETGNTTTKRIAEVGLGLSNLATTLITTKEIGNQLMDLANLDMKKDGVGLGKLMKGQGGFVEGVKGGFKTGYEGSIGKGASKGLFKQLGALGKGVSGAASSLLRFTPIVGQLITLGVGINEVLKFITGEGIFDLLKSDADKAADRLRDLAEAPEKTQSAIEETSKLEQTNVKIKELSIKGATRSNKEQIEFINLQTQRIKEETKLQQTVNRLESANKSNESIVKLINQAKSTEVTNTEKLNEILQKIALEEALEQAATNMSKTFSEELEKVNKSQPSISVGSGFYRSPGEAARNMQAFNKSQQGRSMATEKFAVDLGDLIGKISDPKVKQEKISDIKAGRFSEISQTTGDVVADMGEKELKKFKELIQGAIKKAEKREVVQEQMNALEAGRLQILKDRLAQIKRIRDNEKNERDLSSKRLDFEGKIVKSRNDMMMKYQLISSKIKVDEEFSIEFRKINKDFKDKTEDATNEAISKIESNLSKFIGSGSLQGAEAIKGLDLSAVNINTSNKYEVLAKEFLQKFQDQIKTSMRQGGGAFDAVQATGIFSENIEQLRTSEELSGIDKSKILVATKELLVRGELTQSKEIELNGSKKILNDQINKQKLLEQEKTYQEEITEQSKTYALINEKAVGSISLLAELISKAAPFANKTIQEMQVNAGQLKLLNNFRGKELDDILKSQALQDEAKQLQIEQNTSDLLSVAKSNARLKAQSELLSNDEKAVQLFQERLKAEVLQSENANKQAQLKNEFYMIESNRLALVKSQLQNEIDNLNTENLLKQTRLDLLVNYGKMNELAAQQIQQGKLQSVENLATSIAAAEQKGTPESMLDVAQRMAEVNKEMGNGARAMDALRERLAEAQVNAANLGADLVNIGFDEAKSGLKQLFKDIGSGAKSASEAWESFGLNMAGTLLDRVMEANIDSMLSNLSVAFTGQDLLKDSNLLLKDSVDRLNTTIQTTPPKNDFIGPVLPSDGKFFGGKIQKFNQGGFVKGEAGVDKVPAMLTAGEYVLNKKQVREITKKFNEGGIAERVKAGAKGAAQFAVMAGVSQAIGKRYLKNKITLLLSLINASLKI